jgi:hypothetical protein
MCALAVLAADAACFSCMLIGECCWVAARGSPADEMRRRPPASTPPLPPLPPDARLLLEATDPALPGVPASRFGLLPLESDDPDGGGGAPTDEEGDADERGDGANERDGGAEGGRDGE